MRFDLPEVTPTDTPPVTLPEPEAASPESGFSITFDSNVQEDAEVLLRFSDGETIQLTRSAADSRTFTASEDAVRGGFLEAVVVRVPGQDDDELGITGRMEAGGAVRCMTARKRCPRVAGH